MSRSTGTPSAPLAHLEESIAPDPAFAADLRNTILTAASEPGRTTQLPVAAPLTWPTERTYRSITTRRRLLDLVAVAVLLLTMIGSLAGTTQLAHSPATPSAIPAPQTFDVLVQPGGTGAQGLQFGGPAPSSGQYELAWHTRTYKSSTWTKAPRIVGDSVYALIGGPDDSAQTFLAAYDLATGNLRWQTSASDAFDFVVDSDGIIIAVNDSSDATPTSETTPRPIHFVRLDTHTGEVVWQSGPYSFVGTPQPYQGLAAGSTNLYLSLGAGDIVAINLATGKQAWLHSYSDTNRTFGYLAVSDGVVYFTDTLGSIVGALDADTGSVQWSVRVLSASLPEDFQLGMVVATPNGLVATSYLPPNPGETFKESRIFLLGRSDGAVQWTREFGTIGFPFISDGTSVWVLAAQSGKPAQFTCCLEQINIATGESTWSGTDFDGSYPIGFLPDAGVLVISQLGTGRTELMNPETHESTELTTDPSGFPCSRFTLPVGKDQSIACFDDPRQIQIYRLTSPDSQASPTPEQPTVNADATGGGQVAGGSIADGNYALRWRTDPAIVSVLAQATTFGNTVYTRTGDEADSPITLMAHDLATGAVRWQATIAPNTAVIPTSAGVMTLVPDAADPSLIRVVRLSSETGAVQMISAVAFPTADAFGPWTILLVTGTTVLISDVSGLVTALDLMTGQTRWTANGDRVPAAGLSANGACYQGQGCVVRSRIVPDISSDGTTVYLADPLTATVSAIDLDTGRIRWQSSVLDWMPAASLGRIAVIATSRGPLIVTTTINANDEAISQQFRLLALATGGLVWQQDMGGFASYPVVAGHGTFYLSTIPETTGATPYPEVTDCCLLTEYSLTDGSVIWQQDASDPMHSIDGYLSASDTILLSTFAMYHHESVGMNATTHEQTFVFAPNDRTCVNVLYPVAVDGSVLCQNTYGNSVAVFAPIPEAAPIASPSP